MPSRYRQQELPSGRPLPAYRDSSPPRHQHRRKVSAILLSIIGGLVVIVVVAASLTGCGKTPAAISSSSPPAARPSPTDSTTTLTGWWNTYGKSAQAQLGTMMKRLLADMEALSADASKSNYNAVIVDLADLEGEVKMAQAYPPIPEATLEKSWSAAVADLSAGTMDCLNGIQNSDASTIQQCTSEFQNASTALQTLTSDIQQ